MCIRSGKCIFLNITASLLLGLNQTAITGQDIICGGNNIDSVVELYEIALTGSVPMKSHADLAHADNIF